MYISATRFEQRLQAEGVVDASGAAAVREDAAAAVERAARAALSAPEPTPESLTRDVFAPELQHVLTRGMGAEDRVRPDICESPCFDGDRLISKSF